jgi:hypothetical protein
MQSKPKGQFVNMKPKGIRTRGIKGHTSSHGAQLSGYATSNHAMSSFSCKVPMIPIAIMKEKLNYTNISESMTAAERTTVHSRTGLKLSNNFMDKDSISVDNSIRH